MIEVGLAINCPPELPDRNRRVIEKYQVLALAAKYGPLHPESIRHDWRSHQYQDPDDGELFDRLTLVSTATPITEPNPDV